MVRIILLLIGTMLGVNCTDQSPSGKKTGPSREPQRASHVGRATCASCHTPESDAWSGSHHDLAMQHAADATVLGDFDGATFRHSGVTSRFFRDGDRFMVRTADAQGELRDFEIGYTFGVDPLQQYLIEFPDGRLQALSISWDTRPASAGGQRWFHLYPDETIDHDDVLHWTGAAQNWNYMCAECHSTQLQKRYDSSADRYDTRWFEIDVSCEACHGPGSQHVDWARESERTGSSSIANLGLEVRLKDSSGGSWIFDDGAATARRTRKRASDSEIQTCARCHARRTQLTDAYVHGKPLADTHRVALLDESLYHADGQIKDEVYVYGSFLQSKMFREGVSCGDCHDPHRADLRSAGNATCAGCHRGSVFDSAEHHHHPAGSSGSSCVACHMPVRQYMVVDPRHDHSLRVPRPDLSLKLGTPNACTDCHTDRQPSWAAAAVARWYPEGRQHQAHFAEAIHAARAGRPDAGSMLESLIADRSQPDIVRATALSLLAGSPTSGAAETIGQSIDDQNPLVRRAAAEALQIVEPRRRLELGLPLLDDPLRSVRIAAAAVLASTRASASAEQLSTIERGLEDYATVQRFNSDRAEGRLNLGWYYLQRGNVDQAESTLISAVAAAPQFIPASINLADFYRSQRREAEGERILREALRLNADSGQLHHALALGLTRQKRPQEALDHFERAVSLEADEPHYAYVHAIALHSMERSEDAIESIRNALILHPTDAELRFMLAAIHRDLGQAETARRETERLLESWPDHAGGRGLLQELSRSD